MKHHPTVFIASTPEESAWVSRFSDSLRAEGIEVWSELSAAATGAEIRQSVQAGLKRSDVVVIIVSPHSLASSSVFFEIGAALAMGKMIIPVVARGTKLSEVPVSLSERKWVVRSDPAQTAREVASALLATKA
ncbi:MAG TPA: toll/interleukin-1 receptor domain-containing protein [Planctomycetaceae bacterium]|nr:toll/interleukin-1 receptor domain-containing protein [Planctomycetaceae bacterium]